MKVKTKNILLGNKRLEKCSCSGYTLDKLVQPLVLSLLQRQPMYGYSILQALGDRCEEKPDSTGVYRTLNNMEKRGMVASTWDTNDAGPAKKIYEITAEGEKCLRLWLPTLENYIQYVQDIVGDLKKVIR